MQLNAWALTGIVLVAAMTFYLGHRSSRFASSTHDFLVARRTVRSRRNAAAISGEYLSAASFLGVAGIVLKEGADGLWYPIGFTAGYLALMLFVAAPLRRSGAYTLPDFIEARLGSVALRRCATAFVVVIGILYLVPQLQGAGLALSIVLPVPWWVGALAVMVLVLTNVLAGGMRAITVVQAFQYWLKLFALAVPAFVLCAVFVTSGHNGPSGSLGSPAPPTFPADTTVRVETNVGLRVTTVTPVRVRLPGEADDRIVVWAKGATEQVAEGTELRFAAGTPVPVVSDAASANSDWLRPGRGGVADLLQTYSLLLATFLGTMGLPHVLVRFYTNPDGKAARRTAVHVLLLLGLFYLFPTLLGAMSRMYVPQLLVTGQTDAAVLRLPQAVLPGVGGDILTGVVMAGAFAAFLSTSSGLLVSVAGVVSTDLFKGRVRDFRWSAGLVGILPALLALTMRATDLSLSVGMSFALAASTFSPVLVLGIWWRRLTWPGAMTGMIVGGGLVVAALVLNTISGYTGGWAPWLADQPALITVPVAFAVTVLVSLATPDGKPADVNNVMLRLHAPDPLGFMRDRAVARFGQVENRHRAGRGRHRK
ncbi:Na+(H+)/acetate symporter ActP [Amycolatopsis bartoniae]|uniref:Cation acetate symporter n=1 Tax=Amycolatopsis bartoniae TaxID=941986 RepID=A0A8H9ME64_9PSEU|nr:cation acetate symporter [Amycolatopsis bartoniae]MBB2933334.1 Na+(H+)/acetate symporter ActP [Amycolatopsis bartoniae]TVT08061.1 cation acetate symporter [Amycolatopsis bartoniae]GHF58784.1 cation acetate symporter [Amycolatopsis bartoniae]